MNSWRPPTGQRCYYLVFVPKNDLTPVWEFDPWEWVAVPAPRHIRSVGPYEYAHRP